MKPVAAVVPAPVVVVELPKQMQQTPPEDEVRGNSQWADGARYEKMCTDFQTCVLCMYACT